MNSRLSVLITPRDRVPYQQLLYQAIEANGVRVQYTDGPTPSQTLNLALAPALLTWWRMRGFRILHIHWTFQFWLPWARGALWARRTMEWWFALYLRVAQLLGFSIVWTAHDLLPFEPVFANDLRAREVLLSKAKVVIALSDATAAELRQLGARHVSVIPHGPFDSPYPVTLTKDEARASFGFTADDVVMTLIGRIEPYKGVDLLLQAACALPPSSRIKIVIAGSCSNESERSELLRLSSHAGTRVTSHFEWVPTEDVARYLQATDFAVFPFRTISNSGSVILAQSFGLPVLISNLSALRDIPDEVAVRFEPDVDSVVAAMLLAEGLSGTQRRRMSEAGRAWSQRISWAEIALATVDVYERARLTSNDVER
jgi:glycosyltransferase involved in cell wall biosynthesis